MVILSVALTLAFTVITCIIEIPAMLRDKLWRELITFSVLLCVGMILAFLKSLDLNLPNPSDWVSVIYSPFSDLLKNYFE
jgi:glucan phosphoethanolaminetransferase (alkaline phosphatase superfamily)